MSQIGELVEVVDVIVNVAHDVLGHSSVVHTAGDTRIHAACILEESGGDGGAPSAGSGAIPECSGHLT